ncbi:hypothetical protein Ciccas_008797 [Cichlidogyrus casuarinus]|uniref:HMA domain-containing protein n=1 Tax=Cichlidogyrus casuarinus TaxID=1844966 RepID=A0ABD2Q1L3_9PLAT
MFLSEGVHQVLVSLMASRAEIIYDDTFVTPDQLADKVNELGFHAQHLDQRDQSDTDHTPLALQIDSKA